MSHKKSINKRLATAKAAVGAQERDITSSNPHVQAKSKKEQVICENTLH